MEEIVDIQELVEADEEMDEDEDDDDLMNNGDLQMFLDGQLSQQSRPFLKEKFFFIFLMLVMLRSKPLWFCLTGILPSIILLYPA